MNDPSVDNEVSLIVIGELALASYCPISSATWRPCYNLLNCPPLRGYPGVVSTGLVSFLSVGCTWFSFESIRLAKCLRRFSNPVTPTT